MENIKNIDELKQLAHGERFYVIKNGNVICYFFAGEHPKGKSLIIAIPTYSYTDAVVFGERLFNDKTVVLKGEYLSKQIGLEMISQCKKEIESIEDTYLRELIKP